MVCARILSPFAIMGGSGSANGAFGDTSPF